MTTKPSQGFVLNSLDAHFLHVDTGEIVIVTSQKRPMNSENNGTTFVESCFRLATNFT